MLASLLDTLIYSNTETFWQAPKFSLCDLAWWECGAFHLSKVAVAYMPCERKLLLSAVFLLLSFTVDSPVLTSMRAAWEINTSLRQTLDPTSQHVGQPGKLELKQHLS